MKYLKLTLLVLNIFIISKNCFAQNQTEKTEEERFEEQEKNPGFIKMKKYHESLLRGGPEDETERERIIDSLFKIGKLYPSQQKATKTSGLSTLSAGSVIPAPVPLGTEHSFANDKLKGSYVINKVTNSADGVRLDRTVYDPDANRIYAINTVGNLMDGLLVDNGILQRRNQKIIIEEQGFTGIKLPSGKFRLIGATNSEWTSGSLHYSDDDGRTWVQAKDAEYNQKNIYFTEALSGGVILSWMERTNASGVKEFVLIKSDDYGVNYNVIQSFPLTTTKSIIGTKAYNSDICYFVRKILNVAKWEIYKYEDSKITLISTQDVAAVSQDITAVINNGLKMYISKAGGGGYYTTDAIQLTALDKMPDQIETIFPDLPNIVISREPQHDYSDDGGVTWQKYPNNNGTVGWDPKHLTFYKKSDGKWVFVVANDMGLSFNTSANAITSTDWKYVNNDHSYAILHGGAADDETGLTITSNQDPGTFELSKTGYDTYFAKKQQGADGLSAAISNGGKAYWFHHYWLQFFHRHNASTGDTREATLSVGTDDWYNPPFKGSTKPGEDAIYVTGYKQLKKLTYNTSTNKITSQDLPTDFSIVAGDVPIGIGVAKSDPNRIYVATKNKRFFYSTDAGLTLTETSYTGAKPNYSTPLYNQSAGYYIEVADNNPDLVFWGSQSGTAACLVSKDGGKTFTANMNGMPTNQNIKSISLSPDAKLAFSSNFYMYVADDNKWYSMVGESLPNGIEVKAVKYLPKQKIVRYFTWGAGMLDFRITALPGDVTTSVKQDKVLANKIIVFPNPVKSTLNIAVPDELLNKEGAKITIHNVLGQTLFTQNINKFRTKDFSTQIDGIPEGFHLLKITFSDGSVYDKKIIKE